MGSESPEDANWGALTYLWYLGPCLMVGEGWRGSDGLPGLALQADVTHKTHP
jgi:hypothetical protein